jgi:hypothetical protein
MYHAGWARQAAFVIVAHLPLLLMILLSAPLLMLGPFLPEPLRSQASRHMLELRGWSRDILERCRLESSKDPSS